MKRGLALGTMFCLVLGFQNCSQSSLQGSASEDVSINLSSAGGTGGVENATGKVTYVEVPFTDNQESFQQKAIGSSRLVISLASGEIQTMDDTNAVLDRRCLSAAHLEELKTILAGSSVCEAAKNNADMCAMRYKPGYASLFVNEKRVNLGEELDSCGRGRKDLCGAATDVFKAYLDFVKTHLSEMSCEQ